MYKCLSDACENCRFGPYDVKCGVKDEDIVLNDDNLLWTCAKRKEKPMKHIFDTQEEMCNVCLKLIGKSKGYCDSYVWSCEYEPEGKYQCSGFELAEFKAMTSAPEEVKIAKIEKTNLTDWSF